jgi:hypothetical protein
MQQPEQQQQGDGGAGGYWPPGPPPLVFEEFEGINTSTTRPGVDDKQMAWCDGFMPIGPRYLRTLYGVGPAIYTAPGNTTIVAMFAVNIGQIGYMIVFLTGGSVQAINLATNVVTVLLPGGGGIASPSPTTVGVTQWGANFIIIVAAGQPSNNGFWIWDGSTVYAPGVATPTSSPWGPAGVMPTGVGGTAVVTYQSRVWIANGPTITVTAPGTLNDVNPSHGAGAFTSSDPFLKNRFSQLVQSSGFLYLIGDSSVNTISNVSTTTTLTYTNQNADPEVGTPWPNAVLVFGRNIMLANTFGVHAAYGGALTKVSEALDGVYNTVNVFGQNFNPTFAKAEIFGKKVLILLYPIIDPISGLQVNKLLMWDGKKWWVSTQELSLTFITSQEFSSVLVAWGTDGFAVHALFQQPSVQIEKIVQSKLWARPGGYMFTKASTRLWGVLQYFNVAGQPLSVAIDNEIGGTTSETIAVGPTLLTWTNNAGQPILWSNNVGQPMVWYAVGAGGGLVVLQPQAIGQQGALTGLTMSTTVADMAIVSMSMRDEIVQYRG